MVEDRDYSRTYKGWWVESFVPDNALDFLYEVFRIGFPAQTMIAEVHAEILHVKLAHAEKQARDETGGRRLIVPNTYYERTLFSRSTLYHYY